MAATVIAQTECYMSEYIKNHRQQVYSLLYYIIPEFQHSVKVKLNYNYTIVIVHILPLFKRG